MVVWIERSSSLSVSVVEELLVLLLLCWLLILLDDDDDDGGELLLFEDGIMADIVFVCYAVASRGGFVI